MPSLRTRLGPAAFALFGACAIPTEAPIYDTTWEIPGKSTSISVNTLLPNGVQVSSDNSAFQVTVSPSSVTITRSLSQDCSMCAALNGITAPKPPFTGSGSASVTIPSAITTATLVRDTLTLTLDNGLNFDPIRPSSTARGYLATTVRNGATVIGRDSVDGATAAFPAGSSMVRKISLTGTLNGAAGIQVTMTLHSPAGDPVVIDANRSITATGTVGAFFVSSAQVSVANQMINSAPSDLDLSGIDSTLSKRVDGGTLLLTVVNPFNVSGNLAVNFAGATLPIQKTITLAGGTTTPTIAFTKSELVAMFGRRLSLTYSGSVNGASATVVPGQVVSVTSRLQVAVPVGAK